MPSDKKTLHKIFCAPLWEHRFRFPPLCNAIRVHLFNIFSLLFWNSYNQFFGERIENVFKFSLLLNKSLQYKTTKLKETSRWSLQDVKKKHFSAELRLNETNAVINALLTSSSAQVEFGPAGNKNIISFSENFWLWQRIAQ